MRAIIALLLLLPLVPSPSASQDEVVSLLEARGRFKTKLAKKKRESEPLEQPLGDALSIVSYGGPLGEMTAYLSRAPEREGKSPAIIWLIGGFPAGGGDQGLWLPSDPRSDESARQYREAGIVMMYPALRGSYGNPGYQESFFGEVNDVLAALDYLLELDHVDPNRIYLGGHSTGGTLALLVAAATDKFRAVFAFGPAESVAAYGPQVNTYKLNRDKENNLRAPILFLDAIEVPTWVIEGADESNSRSLRAMKRSTDNPLIRFYLIQNADHYSPLAATNRLFANRIISATGEEIIQVTRSEISAACRALKTASRQADDLETLAGLLRNGLVADEPRHLNFHLLFDSKQAAERAITRARKADFEIVKFDEESEWDFSLTISITLKPENFTELFRASKAAENIAVKTDGFYAGWDVE